MVRAVERGLPLGRLLSRLVRLDAVTADFARQAENLRLQGELEPAAWLCARGLQRFPDYASGHVVMGEILREQGHPDVAERQWREALRCHPEHPRAHLRLAQLYLGRGELSAAMAELEMSLLYSPNSPEATALFDHARASEQAAPATAESIAARRALTEALLSAGRRSGATAVVLGDRGALLGGELGRPQQVAGTTVFGATLMLESRLLLARMGAGQLQSAVLQGAGGSVHCYQTHGVALIVVGPEVGKTELDRAVAALRDVRGPEGEAQ